MTEGQIKSVSLFFYLAFLQEPLAIKASRRSIATIRKRVQRNKGSLKNIDSILVHVTYKFWDKLATRRSFIRPELRIESGWVVPENLELGAWRQFQRESSSEEFLAVIWSKVLGFSDKTIAEGLGTTEGTVRYRVGNGLRQLGSFIHIDELIQQSETRFRK